MFIKFEDKLINYDLIGYVELVDYEMSIDFYTKENKLMCRHYFNDTKKLKEEFDKLYDLLNQIKSDAK